MGLIFTTAGWLTAEIVWTHADGAATYSVLVDVANAYDVAVALRDWLDDGARPWAAHISGVTLTVQDDGAGRDRFVYAFTGSGPTFVSIAPNGRWTSRFGDTSAVPPTSARASCSVVPGTQGWERLDATASDRSREGSWRPVAQRTSHRRPRVAFGLSLTQAYWFGAAIRAASEPREAVVYDEARDAWRKVAVGFCQADGHPNDPLLVAASMDVRGGL